MIIRLEQLHKLARRTRRVATHWSKRAARKYDSLYIGLFEQLWRIKQIRHIIRPVFKYSYPKRHWAPAVLSLLMITSAIIPVLNDTVKAESYSLSQTAAQIVTPSNKRLMDQVSYEPTKQTFQFNKEGIPKDDSMPAEIAKNSLGTPGDKDATTFAADLPTDLAKGITYHDVNSQLSFKLIPQHLSSAGQASQGRIVYPMPGDMQAVYTIKANGVKEDIIVEHTNEAELSFSYKLELPKTLEARIRPDGSVGIFSADPTLFGNITYGSDEDKSRVIAARENGEKTTATFVIPAPVIIGQDGKSVPNTSAVYTLEGNTLTVKASGLDKLSQPVSIDPSVVITSTTDFQTQGNNEGMIDYSVSGQITRGGLTGGSVGAWSATSALPGGRFEHAMTVYNGYAYIVTGNSGTAYPPHTLIAPIASNGTIGTWVQSPFNYDGARVGLGLVAYNGCLYLTGGFTGDIKNDSQYAKINADGSINAWQYSTNMNTARSWHGMAAYNNYMYVFGGNITQTTSTNTVEYAPIKGDGSLGTWVTTSAMTNTRAGLGAVVYNGFAYIFGGTNNTTTDYADSQYSSINADGSLGAWAATTALPAARGYMSYGQYNGYLYSIGGISGSTYRNDVLYAPIEADGTIGAWASTNSIATASSRGAAIFYNGYAYNSGGTNGTAQADVQYAKIDEPGSIVPVVSTGNNLPVARSMMCSVSYGGYLYAIGGSTSNDGNNNSATIYAATITPAGVRGTWAATATSLPVASSAVGCTIFNGYLYVAGGYTGAAVVSNAVRYATISGATIGTFTTAGTALPVATPSPGVFTYTSNNISYLYVIKTTDQLIYYTPITAATGATGAWTSGPSITSTVTERRAWAQIGNILYSIGSAAGTGGSLPQNGVMYSVINTSTGVPGAWTGTTSLSAATSSMNGAVAVNGCLYILGGQQSSATTYKATVQYACPDASGAIAAGGWKTSPSTLTANTGNLAVTSYNGYIYGIGGYNGTAVVATTQTTKVNNGGPGMTGTNGLATTALPTNATVTNTGPRHFHSTVAYNGYLYVMAGQNGSTYLDSIYIATLNGSGAVSSWTLSPEKIKSLTGVASPRAYTSASVYNGKIYLTGGYNGTTFFSDYQYWTVQFDGTLSTGTNALPMTLAAGGTATGRATHGSITYNGFLYVVGGLSTTTTYLTNYAYAPINDNGSIGNTWVQSGAVLPVGRATTVAVAYNGFFYVLGGRTAATTYINSVLVAPINAGGALGSFTYTSSFKNTRNYLGTAIANGYLYIFGGWDGTTYYQDIQYAVIHGNGTLGPWQTAGNMSTGRYGVSAVYYDGYMYVTGGTTGTSQGTVDYLAVQSIQRIGRYTKLLDFGSAVGAIKSFDLSGLIPGQDGALSYRTAPSDGVFGTANFLSTDTRSQTCSTVSRYVLLVLVLDDSGGKSGGAGAFPDSSSTDAYATDLTVNTQFGHPPPQIRLRHGQTLQLGSLSQLDTCETVNNT